MQLNTTRRIATAAMCLILTASLQAQELPNLFPFPNEAGLVATYNIDKKPIPLGGAFFQSLGANGRSCSTCHRPAQGWSIAPAEIKARFEITAGRDPLFRTVDGANCDHGLNTSTVQSRREAYSLLLQRGVVRVSMQVPANAEFTVMQARNSYGCGDLDSLSLYRRPLPSTNLRFSSAVMWDGRESAPQIGTQKITFETNPSDLLFDLSHQANSATTGHAEATTPLTPEQEQEIVEFEMKLVTAQAFDYRAGRLNAGNATGGPMALGTSTQRNFFVGINDPLGGNPHGTAFTPKIFGLYDAWASGVREEDEREFELWRRESRKEARASILRGQELFNSKPIAIRNVAGLNDDLGVDTIPGTCGTCHDSPSVGNHSLPVPLNIGVADENSSLDVKYLPVYVLRNNATGEIQTTTDPGRALVTGLWKDVGKFKGPILRGLASRPPYFHNGSAQSLSEVLDFYDTRFGIGFTTREKADLVAFLKTL